MAVNWVKIKDRKPEDGQECLTKMKPGVIQGVYDANENIFSGYYWTDIEWKAYEWIPIEEIG